MTSPILNLLSAAASAGQAPPAWVQFLPLIGIAGVFWFLLLRPQMRQQKEHREKIGAVKKGDQVVTGGGFVGKVTRVDDIYADIELAPNVKVKAVKATITDVLSPTGKGAAND
ncbi:MAG: preprotein translocase subunit YajC [Novosphingobium sp.]